MRLSPAKNRWAVPRLLCSLPEHCAASAECLLGPASLHSGCSTASTSRSTASNLVVAQYPLYLPLMIAAGDPLGACHCQCGCTVKPWPYPSSQ
jgi:hypothetical protein